MPGGAEIDELEARSAGRSVGGRARDRQLAESGERSEVEGVQGATVGKAQDLQVREGWPALLAELGEATHDHPRAARAASR